MTLTGLNYLGKKFDIEMKGTGKFIESIESGGAVIRGSNKLPADLYSTKDRLKVIVRRVIMNPYSVSITDGTGIELREYTNTNNTIRARISGAGLCRLKLVATHKPRVKLSGKMATVIYDAGRNTATVEISLQPGQSIPIKIY